MLKTYISILEAHKAVTEDELDFYRTQVSNLIGELRRLLGCIAELEAKKNRIAGCIKNPALLYDPKLNHPLHICPHCKLDKDIDVPLRHEHNVFICPGCDIEIMVKSGPGVPLTLMGTVDKMGP